MATAHIVLMIVYYLLCAGTTYKELGANYFVQRDKTRIERHHMRRLGQLSYTVTLNAAAVV